MTETAILDPDRGVRKDSAISRGAVDRMQVRIEHLDTLLSLAGEVIKALRKAGTPPRRHLQLAPGREDTEEVAAVALLLARDEAHNISGCLFPVDGGTMPY
jgi:NAD(P)-dependent dehydrogenase (short-subunit alcohol dehydrogenase family)